VAFAEHYLGVEGVGVVLLEDDALGSAGDAA